MNTLLTIREQDITPGAPVTDSAGYRRREAARAVVFDSSGKVALLHVGLHGYHKLPGGGIDAGEDARAALARELSEEIGCKAEVTGEIGRIVEYRDQYKLEQISYCFIAAQIGEKGVPDFTDKELQEQFSIVWANKFYIFRDSLAH